MRIRAPAVYLGLAAIAALLASSLKMAVERIETFPVHRAYAVVDGFIRFSIGNLNDKANYRCFSPPAGGLLFADNGKLPTQAYYDIVMYQFAYLAKIDPKIDSISRAYSLEGMPYWRKLALYYLPNAQEAPQAGDCRALRAMSAAPAFGLQPLAAGSASP